MDKHLAEIGQLIRARREELGLTREELAERVGKSDSYMKQIELGKAELNSIKTLFQIANALETTPHSLLPYNSGKWNNPKSKRVFEITSILVTLNPRVLKFIHILLKLCQMQMKE